MRESHGSVDRQTVRSTQIVPTAVCSSIVSLAHHKQPSPHFVMMMMIIKLVYLFLATPSLAFVVGPAPRPSTRVYLEDHIADMIDGELYRQQHKKEFEEAWMRKNRGAILQQLNSGVSMLEEEETDFRQYAKDRKLAGEDPARYCADRCIATGNCDVYEDL